MNGTATASPSTIYVDAEGGEDYTTIQGAINSAYPGDTIIVYPGIYTESVNVYKANLQILSYSGNPEDTVVENLGSGYNFAISANNVTISGFNITGTNSTGIYMSGISGANITNNKLSEVDRGVYLDSSSNCTLDDNTVSNTYDYGIFLDESVSCTLTDNEVSNVDGNGIYLWYSSDCTLTGNIVSDAYDGIYLDSSSNCTLDDNTVSNTYDYGIFLDESVSCTLIDNEVSNIDGDGIYLYYSGSCTLTGNIISDAYDGIYLDSSDNCTLTGNIISDAYDGIYLDLSDSCTLAYNTVSSTYDEGFFLGNSDNCSLTSNTVSNANYGIDLYDSRECILRNNTVSSGIYGISLCEVQNCTFTDNNMSGNWYNFNYDIYDFYDFDNVSGNVIDTSNLVDGKVVYFLENEPDPSIGINAGVIYCINCGEVEIKDFVLQNNSYAIFLYNTSSKMQNNTINNTEFGISVFSSQDVELSDSRVNNSWAGIVFEEDLNINLTGNTVRNSTYGIVTYYSENCTLTGNSVLDSMDYYGFIASGNSKLVKSEESTPVHENTFINSNLIQAVMPRSYGIYSVYCQNLRIENNLIDQIAYRGVYLEDCQNARLVSNSVRNIESVGIYLVSSSGVDLLGNTVHNVTGTLLVYDAGVKESMVSTPVNSSLVQVSNRFSGVGILSEYSQDLRLENNDVSQMDVGILLGVCQNIELVSNSVSDAEYMGICAVESSGVDILDNVVHNVTGGYILPAAGYLPLVSSPLSAIV
ncbi:right-handed parallel beta-helix repeat-containing protein [Methanosarcina horonobensis]|uniref:right-handed parallel beta-helix repeat-containing protein n=1 Tax=Methanosarcina horonobensis TaxID=418008 RepID=UPI000A7B3E1E|nr:NosD domain-containing protein [Methanosarcina horonobensis]